MAEIRDFFIKSLDEAECGIKGMMIKLTQELKKNDFQVWSRLNQQELCPEYYSFRYERLNGVCEFALELKHLRSLLRLYRIACGFASF